MTNHDDLKNHAIVSREEWLSARIELLAREKEFTRLREELSRPRRELPWVKVDKPYLFERPAVPKGRDETGRGPFWVRRHDEFGR